MPNLTVTWGMHLHLILTAVSLSLDLWHHPFSKYSHVSWPPCQVTHASRCQEYFTCHKIDSLWFETGKLTIWVFPWKVMSVDCLSLWLWGLQYCREYWTNSILRGLAHHSHPRRLTVYSSLSMITGSMKMRLLKKMLKMMNGELRAFWHSAVS